MSLQESGFLRFPPVLPVVSGAKRVTVATVPDRVAWADLAKGWSIVLVVIMHSTLGVGDDMGGTGWLHQVVAWAKPFRMPDFFLVAGLFAASALKQPLRRFLDKRLVHFVYFYVLWAVLAIVAKGVVEHGLDGREIGGELLRSLYDPYSSLWFIYTLPVMFLIVRALRDLPALPVLAAASALHVLAAAYADGGRYALSANLTGSFALDSLALFLVFFLAGHYGRDRLLALAQGASENPGLAAAGLVLWAAFNTAGVWTGVSDLPGGTLLFGLAGALAVVVASALMAKLPAMGWLAAIGRKSLVIYVSFAIPMAATRLVLIKTGVVSDIGWVSALTALTALLLPLLLERLVRATPLSFLYSRPQWARLR